MAVFLSIYKICAFVFMVICFSILELVSGIPMAHLNNGIRQLLMDVMGRCHGNSNMKWDDFFPPTYSLWLQIVG